MMAIWTQYVIERQEKDTDDPEGGFWDVVNRVTLNYDPLTAELQKGTRAQRAEREVRRQRSLVRTLKAKLAGVSRWLRFWRSRVQKAEAENAALRMEIRDLQRRLIEVATKKAFLNLERSRLALGLVDVLKELEREPTISDPAARVVRVKRMVSAILDDRGPGA